MISSAQAGTPSCDQVLPERKTRLAMHPFDTIDQHIAQKISCKHKNYLGVVLSVGVLFTHARTHSICLCVKLTANSLSKLGSGDNGIGLQHFHCTSAVQPPVSFPALSALAANDVVFIL